MKRSRINPQSKKRRKKIDDERQVRADYLLAHPSCVLSHLGGCYGELHVHEPWTRARGGPTDNPLNMRTLCDHHNTMISQDAEMMAYGYEHGLLVHEWQGQEWLDSQHV